MNFRMIFTSPETRIIVLPDTEDRMIVSSFLKTPERDGQTDGQTDRNAVAITAVCIASSADAL